jgi:ketosteroid isomerase-like protein
MNNIEILRKFYAAMEAHDWTTKRSLMHDDFSFRGPLMQADSADQMIGSIQQMNCSMTFKDVRMAEAGDTVMAFFTCEMTRPAQLSFRCAERVTLKDGLIKASELIYDPRAFPSMD